MVVLANSSRFARAPVNAVLGRRIGTYQESCPLGVLELCTFKQLTSICALGSS
jgi:hypothetical protein